MIDHRSNIPDPPATNLELDVLWVPVSTYVSWFLSTTTVRPFLATVHHLCKPPMSNHRCLRPRLPTRSQLVKEWNEAAARCGAAKLTISNHRDQEQVPPLDPSFIYLENTCLRYIYCEYSLVKIVQLNIFSQHRRRLDCWADSDQVYTKYDSHFSGRYLQNCKGRLGGSVSHWCPKGHPSRHIHGVCFPSLHPLGNKALTPDS